jgi:hypothetical protein
MATRLAWVILGPGLWVVGGCGSGGGSHMATPPQPAVARAPGATQLVGRPQAAVLWLAAGRSTAKFTITALAPREHTWDVTISAPAGADVEVHIVTWYGVSFSVLDTTRDRQSCATSRGRTVCVLRFPLLEAQRPGPWTVIARKRTAPAAAVRVQVTFHATEAG